MFEKIAAFFRSIFRSLFGGAESSSRGKNSGTDRHKPNTNNDTQKELPKAEPDFPQDAHEVDKDTAAAIVVVDESEPVALEPGDDPADNIDPENPGVAAIPADTEVIDAPVITEPETPETETQPPVEEEPPVVEKPRHKARYTWCLDNGHGKRTAGKRSPKLEDGSQFFEYEFNRDIVKKITAQLDEIGVKHFNVVPEIDIDNFLEGRVARANNLKSDLPKIYLSIHSNAFGNSGWELPSGIETWFFHNSRAGRAIARVFQKRLINKLGWKNRNLKSYPGKRQFYVLRNTSMPAVLTENGFYTNKEECKLLMKDNIRQKIADAHVEAILEIERNGL